MKKLDKKIRKLLKKEYHIKDLEGLREKYLALKDPDISPFNGIIVPDGPDGSFHMEYVIPDIQEDEEFDEEEEFYDCEEERLTDGEGNDSGDRE